MHVLLHDCNDFYTVLKIKNYCVNYIDRAYSQINHKSVTAGYEDLDRQNGTYDDDNTLKSWVSQGVHSTCKDVQES